MNKTLLAVAILGVLACHCSLGATEDEKTVEWWKDCGSESDHGKIVHIHTDPEVPQWGHKLDLDVTVETDENVTGGAAHLNITWNKSLLIPFMEVPVCNSGISQIKCPLETGQHHWEISQKIPKYIPQGRYEVTAVVFDQNGEKLGCVQIDLNLKSEDTSEEETEYEESTLWGDDHEYFY